MDGFYIIKNLIFAKVYFLATHLDCGRIVKLHIFFFFNLEGTAFLFCSWFHISKITLSAFLIKWKSWERSLFLFYISKINQLIVFRSKTRGPPQMFISTHLKCFRNQMGNYGLTSSLSSIGKGYSWESLCLLNGRDIIELSNWWYFDLELG